MRYKCSCCENYTLIQESDDICPVCYWQEDIVQREAPDFAGGANEESLNQARKNYRVFGAFNRKFVDKVRKPLYEELSESNHYERRENNGLNCTMEMIQNKIHRVNALDAAKIAQETRNSDCLLLLELCGKEIQSWANYINKLNEVVNFPTSCLNSAYGVNRYHDWIRDLDWLGKDGYVLIIYDYKAFLEQEPSLKKEIIEDFTHLILSWWQEEVVNCVVGGKAKPFNVYLVD